jgi:hypothetical protein
VFRERDAPAASRSQAPELIVNLWSRQPPGEPSVPAVEFLTERAARPLNLAKDTGLDPVALYLGSGQNALEVAVFSSNARPSAGTVKNAWRARWNRRASPVLVVVLYRDRAALCGPAGEDPPVYPDVDLGHAERLCRAALDLPDRHAALAFVSRALGTLETPLPGLRNEGLFALHTLEKAQESIGWAEAAGKAKSAATKRGADIFPALGFKVDRIDNLTMLLRSGDRRSALAVLLDPSEIPEAGAARFNALSPISYALDKADAENLDWVVMVQGDHLRLYPTAVQTGVGRPLDAVLGGRPGARRDGRKAP